MAISTFSGLSKRCGFMRIDYVELDWKHGGEKKLADHLIGELKKAMQP
jgi:hypothetical protein